MQFYGSAIIIISDKWTCRDGVGMYLGNSSPRSRMVLDAQFLISETIPHKHTLLIKLRCQASGIKVLEEECQLESRMILNRLSLNSITNAHKYTLALIPPRQMCNSNIITENTPGSTWGKSLLFNR